MKNIYIKFFVLLFIILGRTELGFSKEDPQKKPISANKKESNSTIALKQEAQNELNTALNNFNASLSSTQTTVIDKMEDIDLDVSALAEENRSKAQKTMAYLDQNPDKVKAFLSFEDLVTFPVGFKQKLSDNSEVTVGIYSVEFDATGASCTFFLRLRTKIDDYSQGASERDLLLGVSGIRFTKQGGMSGDIKAGLLGDFTIPGKNWTVVLKGGGDNIANGSQNFNKTYVLFTCEKFKEVKVSADIVFPRNVIIPFDEPTAKPQDSGRVILSTEATVKSGFRDMILKLSAQNAANNTKAFAVAGFSKFGFKVDDIIVDMSDITNDTGVKFPENYNHPDLGSGLWRGVCIKDLTVIFPKEYEKDNPSDPSKITIEGMIVDKTGFTGKIIYSNSTGLVFAAQKWQFSVKRFGLEFLQNKFISGAFGGSFYTPINSTATSDPNGGFLYDAVLNNTGDASFTISTDANDVPINCWKAKGNIYAGSQIRMEVVNEKFYPSCNLSGSLSIGANGLNASTIEGYESDDNADAKFDGLQFENLKIETKGGFTFSIGGFKYVNSQNSKVARIPVAITRLEKEANSPTGEVWIGLGFKISLLKDKFSGSTDLTIRSYYDNATGKLKLGTLQSGGLPKIGINKVYVSGSTTVFSMIGEVVFFNNSPGFESYGKGFKGELEMALYKPFKVGVRAEALFGKVTTVNDETRYGYFSIFAGKPRKVVSEPGQKPVFVDGDAGGIGTGFKIPTGIGDLAINGLGLGVYFNMRPEFNTDEVDKPIYEVDKDIPFGFKIMLGLQNSTASFNGNVAVDISLSASSGINSIGVFGKATISPSLKMDKIGINSLVKGKSKLELQNLAGVNHTTEGLISNANQLKGIKEKKTIDPNSNDYAEAGIQIALGILIDIPKGIGHAEATVDVNQNGIVGIGPAGRAGKVVLHFEKKNTYIHLGKSPYEERIGLKLQDKLEFGAYVMIGKGIPPFPYPPKEVLTFFPGLKTRLDGINAPLLNPNNTIDYATGFAMGANLKTNINISGWLGYIKGYGVAGLDLMFDTNSGCYGSFLGKGQIYGVADVDAGLGNKRLFRGAVGFYLYGQGLKPFVATGDICVAYGRKNKKLCLNFETQTTCN
jgi:hypothetical protein